MQRRLVGEGIDHKVIAASMQGLGLLLKWKGELEEAEKFSSDRLQMPRRVIRERMDRMDVAEALQNHGNLVKANRNRDEAENYFVIVCKCKNV